MNTKNSDFKEIKRSIGEREREAIWQYFIDHSRVQPNSFLGIMFYVRDEDDFWKRVWSRYTGDFKRYDKLNKEYSQEQTTHGVYRNIERKITRRCEEIDKGRNYKDKLLLWCNRRIRRYLFGNLKNK